MQYVLWDEIVKETAEKTKDADSLGCAKLVVLCNAPDDNPFMAGAFHGVTEDDAIINVGVSGPGVVKYALESVRGESFEVLCETIKKTAFQDYKSWTARCTGSIKETRNTIWYHRSYHLLLHRLSVTALLIFLKKSDLSTQEHREQQQHLHF